MVSRKSQLAEAFPPGDMLQEKLAELEMPVKEFALRCGKPEPTIHDVLKGRSAVTPDMAILFESVLDIPARLWMNLQCQYDEYKARLQHEQELEQNQSWASRFPFSEMVAKGYIQAEKRSTPLDKTNCLLKFFAFAKTCVWEKYYQSKTLKAEFRLSLVGVQDAYALSAWLRHGENKAQEIREIPAYTPEKLKAILPDMQQLANSGHTHFLLPLTELCRQAGIILVCTPHLRNSQAKGATRWLKDTPMVQVADTFKHYDIFWFSFFHELGHILLHGKREVFLEGIEYDQRLERKECEADDYASACLIPRSVAAQLSEFSYSETALVELCRKTHIHPAFAVERLRRLKKIRQSEGEKFIPAVELSAQT